MANSGLKTYTNIRNILKVYTLGLANLPLRYNISKNLMREIKDASYFDAKAMAEEGP